MDLQDPAGGAEVATSDDQTPDEREASFAWNAGIEALLEEWRLRAWAAQMAHYRVASRLRTYNVWLGLPVVVFSTAVGTSLFATLDTDQSTEVRIVVGTISVVAAILAGVQTFFNFSQRADKHVLAADWYASIRRKIEQEVRIPRKHRGDAKKFLDGVRKEMNTVGSQFPEIGDRLWNQVSGEFGLRYPGDERPAGPVPRRVIVDRP
jgi:hypothetical protein